MSWYSSSWAELKLFVTWLLAKINCWWDRFQMKWNMYDQWFQNTNIWRNIAFSKHDPLALKKILFSSEITSDRFYVQSNGMWKIFLVCKKEEKINEKLIPFSLFSKNLWDVKDRSNKIECLAFLRNAHYTH